MSELGSPKRRRQQLARSLRADGRSWVGVAEVMRQRYGVNARVAFRYAHGWSQRQAADEWNQRWPDELRTFKNFSYWETWPSSTGHAPCCVLMASISHDLAEPSAAMIQTRTALAFAELAGHAGLITWVYCTRAMIASWWGFADDVLRHAQRARAAGLEARALAQNGQHQQVIELLHTAQAQRDKLSTIDSLRDLGEVFTFSAARQHYYNAAACGYMCDWEAVERETSSVISLYAMPEKGRYWPVTMTLSQVYLAQARLSLSGPEGAQDALAPVFDVPNEQRIPQTAQALRRIRVQLRSKAYANLPAARGLDEAIHNFRPVVDNQECP